MQKPVHLTRISQISQLSEAERGELAAVEKRFVFRSTDYYQSLIDWDDPHDPIRQIIIPSKAEMDEWGKLDASDEESYTVLPGLQHKYRDTALLLVNDVCGAYCRFCFRKRLFMPDNQETTRDVTRELEYIRARPEITNVLLTGGDPLVMSTPRLAGIIGGVREIPHVNIIRIGTKMPAFSPARILNDPSLAEMISKHSAADRKIYIMAHFNHPRELTSATIEAMLTLQKAGAITVNQTPLIRGINDRPDTLAELFNRLSFIGVPPYYVFQCRPTLGNKTFSAPVEEAYEIFQRAQGMCSGLAKRARFVMSHSSGKVEVVGLTSEQIYMRYHQSADAKDAGRFFALDRNREARWLDDYFGVGEAEGERAAAPSAAHAS
jgi:KamA family protein